MKKRTVTEFEIPEPIKLVTNREKIYKAIIESSKAISFVQLIEKTSAKSYGNMNSNLKVLLNEKRIKKITCKCCDTTELYEILK